MFMGLQIDFKGYLWLFLVVINFRPVLVQAQNERYKESVYPEHYQLVLPQFILYRQGTLWGYADSTGAIKIKPQFSYAQPFETT